MMLVNCNKPFFYLINYSSIGNTDCVYSYFPQNILQDKYYRQVSDKVVGSNSLEIEFKNIEDCLKTLYYRGKY